MDRKYSCIIVDDNQQAISVLKKLLTKYFKQINFLDSANSVAQAVDLVNDLSPDIVFLDVEMPNEKGTALFDYLDNPSFKTIFTTAFEDYASQAFRLSSVDYLVKPVNPAELKEAISKAKKIIDDEERNDTQIVTNYPQSDKITFTALDSIEVFNIEDILYCKAENNYTLVYSEKRKCFVSKTMGYYETVLVPYGFFRVNRSYLVNLNYIEKIDKTGPEVILKGDISIPISMRRKKQFFEVLSGYKE